jgi:hypothetical protein
MLAEFHFVVIFGGVLLALIGALVFAVVGALMRFIRFLFGLATGEDWEMNCAPGRIQTSGTCPHPRCGHQNAPGSRYCGRCGRPLRRLSDVEFYG